MKKITWPLVLIFIGVILLLNNFSLLPWSIWFILWRFWPAVLILVGLEMTLGNIPKRRTLLTIAGAIILAAILYLAIIWAKPSLIPKVSFQSLQNRLSQWPKRLLPQEKKQEYSILDEDYPNLSKRVINLDLEFGQLTLLDQEENQSLFQLIAYYQDPFGIPQVKTNLSNSQTITINFTNRQEKIFFPNRLINKINYQINLGKVSLPTEIKLETGAGQTKISLNKTLIETLSCNVGAGQAQLTISKTSLPKNYLSTNIGAGKLKIDIPTETQINLDYELGSGKIVIGETEINGPKKESHFSTGQDNWPPIIIKAKIGSGKLEINYQSLN